MSNSHTQEDDNVTVPLTVINGDTSDGSPEDTKGTDKQKIDEDEDHATWADPSVFDKVFRTARFVSEFAILILCLYVFICALGVLEDSFKLLGGKAAGETFRNSKLLSNPLAGLMIGVLATVLVQSSSTSSSIVVTMVGAKVIPIETAIPIIMGVNIGTSITNTIVSMAQSGNRVEFRRAFAGATVHDMFNWMTVIVLLPLEMATHYLYHLTKVIADSVKMTTRDQQQGFLKTITKPVIDHIVMVQDNVISEAAVGGNKTAGSLTKRWCQTRTLLRNITTTFSETVPLDCRNPDVADSFRSVCARLSANKTNIGPISVSVSWNKTAEVNITERIKRCEHLFAYSNLSDTAVGVILLLLSLLLIFTSLFVIVKMLHYMLQGSVARIIKKTVNADLPGRAAYFTGYIAMLVGCGMTIIIQSSSVFTSTLTPLVGVGMIDLERMYPMTLGSNIGTTITGILASLSTEKEHLADAFQVAMCHLFYNLSGVLLFYPIPVTRLPIPAAKFLGRTTARYRWFAGFYLIMMFIVLPGIVFALSIAGTAYIATVGAIILLVVIVVAVINVVQRKWPRVLPVKMRDWMFLPYPLRTLRVMDLIVKEVFMCDCLRKMKNHRSHKKKRVVMETPDV